jgi:hypothetical protein
MADTPITVTPGLVVSGSTSQFRSGTAGEDLTAGMWVYLKTSDNKYYGADADATAVGLDANCKNVAGVVVVGGATGATISIQTAGDYICGGTVVPGMVYLLSGTKGGFCPTGVATTLVATDYVTQVGIAISNSALHILIYSTGVQVPAE